MHISQIAAAIVLLGSLSTLTFPSESAAQQAHPAPAAALSNPTKKALQEAITSELKKYGGKDSVPGAVVGVWRHDQAEFVRPIGLANISPRQPMELDDKFRVGSNTKTFVVTVILQLVDEGKMSLGDPLSKFDIGVKVPNAENITVRQICQMQSGLFEVYQSKELAAMNITAQTHFEPRQLISIAIKYPPLFAPGKGWNYSNTNYILLGLIIEAVTSHSVADEIRTRLLVPYHLDQTSFPVDDAAMPQPYAHGYGLDGKGEWEDVTVSLPPSLTWSAGVMTSDMADMKVWVKDYVSGVTNKAATQQERLHCVPTTIGTGLNFGLGIGCTGGWFGYTGGINGYNTAAYYLPAEDAVIIAFVTAQIEKPEPGVANSIVRDITQILFPQHVAFSGVSPGPAPRK